MPGVYMGHCQVCKGYIDMCRKGGACEGRGEYVWYTLCDISIYSVTCVHDVYVMLVCTE